MYFSPRIQPVRGGSIAIDWLSSAISIRTSVTRAGVVPQSQTWTSSGVIVARASAPSNDTVADIADDQPSSWFMYV